MCASKPRLSHTSGYDWSSPFISALKNEEFSGPSWRPVSAEVVNQDTTSVESLTLDHVAFQL